MSKVLYKYHSRPQTAPITRSNAKPSVADNLLKIQWDGMSKLARQNIKKSNGISI